jgi:Prephenate dehydrogenase
MRILIVGLGLIGGSMAQALRGFESCTIVGADRNAETLTFAKAHGICDELYEDAVPLLLNADLTILALHPRGIETFVQTYGNQFKPGSTVTDVCGIKTAIHTAAAHIPSYVNYIGGHPMAGKESSGIENSDAALFQNAHYLLTPRAGSDEHALRLLRRMTVHLGCRDAVVTTPEEHDALIAYTSQVMHVMAVAVCDDPSLFDCRGFEGGSFRDCTRVAALDVPLWAELFSMNAPALIGVIQNLEDNLKAYRQVLEQNDLPALQAKLQYSSDRKRHMSLE